MSTSMLDRRPPPITQLPPRKPIPNQELVQSSHPRLQNGANDSRRYSYNNVRQRKSSAGTLPPMPANMLGSSTTVPPQPYQAPAPSYGQPTRRTPSNATSSTSSSAPGTNGVGAGLRTSTGSFSTSMSTSSASQVPQRSTSNRSGGSSSQSPSSYVSRMRRQKATVWCDRAQHEDPRLLAAQRAAKYSAAMEIVGGIDTGAAGRISVALPTSSGGGLTGGVRSKIRHGGALKATNYNPANMAGAGVPMRLSASEVDEADSDDDSGPAAGTGGGSGGARMAGTSNGHQRAESGSGRSSVGSGKRRPSYGFPTGNLSGNGGTGGGPGAATATGGAVSGGGSGGFNGARRPSATSTPPSGQVSPNATEPGGGGGGGGGFLTGGTAIAADLSSAMRGGDVSSATAPVAGSAGNSGEARENSFGQVGKMPKYVTRERADESGRGSDELRRRGSVDDRTMTMSGQRLFVANPDLSD